MMIEKEEGEDITESLMKNIYKEKDIENYTGIKNYNSKDYLSQKKYYKEKFSKSIHKELSFHKKRIYSMDWLENNTGTILVTGSSDNSIKVWDLNNTINSSNKENISLLTINSHDETVNNIASRNNNVNQFLSSSNDKHIKFWDIRTNISNNNKFNICKASFDKIEKEEIKHLKFNNSGTQFAFMNKDGNFIYLYDLGKFQEIQQINFKPFINDFTFDKNDKKILAASEDGNVYLINLENINNRQAILGSLFQLDTIDINKENKNFITGGNDGILVTYDMDELMSSKAYKQSEQSIKQIMYSSDDRFISCIYDGKNVDFFSTELDTNVYTIYTNNLIHFMNWNKKRNVFVYVCDDKKGEDWKNKTKEENRNTNEGNAHFLIMPNF